MNNKATAEQIARRKQYPVQEEPPEGMVWDEIVFKKDGRVIVRDVLVPRNDPDAPRVGGRKRIRFHESDPV